MRFYNQSIEEVLSELNVDPFKGLDDNEATNRRYESGANELSEEKKTNPLFLFFSQFHSFIIYIFYLQ